MHSGKMMHTRSIFVVAIVFSVLLRETSFVRADDIVDKNTINILRHVKTVSLSVRDNVTGGCFPTPNSAKTVAEKELLVTGLPLTDSGQVHLYFDVQGLPVKNRAGGTFGCSIHANVRATYIASAHSPDKKSVVTARVLVHQNSFSMVSTYSKSQSQIEFSVKALAAKFAVLWLKSRQPVAPN